MLVYTARARALLLFTVLFLGERSSGMERPARLCPETERIIHGTPLTRAVFLGLESEAREIIQCWDVINLSRDYVGSGNEETVLHVAARWGHVSAVRLLLKLGARTALKDKNGILAITWAIKKGYVSICSLLLESAYHEKEPLFDRFLKSFGWQPPTLALNVNYLMHTAAALGRAEIIQTFLDKGISVNAWWDGKTPLHGAAANGNSESIKFLISHGADVNAQREDIPGCTPISCAVEQGHGDAVQLLIEQGADLEVHTDYPSLLACSLAKDYDPIVKLLIRSGASFYGLSHEHVRKLWSMFKHQRFVWGSCFDDSVMARQDVPYNFDPQEERHKIHVEPISMAFVSAAARDSHKALQEWLWFLSVRNRLPLSLVYEALYSAARLGKPRTFLMLMRYIITNDLVEIESIQNAGAVAERSLKTWQLSDCAKTQYLAITNTLLPDSIRVCQLSVWLTVQDSRRDDYFTVLPREIIKMILSCIAITREVGQIMQKKWICRK